MKLKKLITDTQASEGRRMGEVQMKRAPALRPPRRLAWSGAGSAGWMRLRKNAEPRNDSASAASANGADRACTSRPPTLGPPTAASARLW